MSHYSTGASAGLNNGTNSKVMVPSFILVQTGTYQEQYIRPFNINANKNVADQLAQVTNNGLNLGVAAVQEVASQILSPSAMVEGNVNIANGWNSRKFRFMMKVTESHPFIQGTETQRILFGYTDHCDASLNHLPDDMRIYFNSETTIATAIEQTIAGPKLKASIVGSNQIISPVDMTTNANPMFARAHSSLIRPEDLFNIGQTSAVAEKLQSTGQFQGIIDRSIDHRTMVGEGGSFKYSQRRNTSPTRYISDTLQAWQHAVKEEAMTNGDELNPYGNTHSSNNDLMFGAAGTFCRNPQIHTNAFLAILKDYAGYMERGYITFRDLKSLFPETMRSDVTRFAMDNGQSMRKVNFDYDSEHWQGAGHTTIAASLLAQTIPSIMMDTFFRHVSFAVTNGLGNSYAFDINPDGTKSIIDNIDMRQYILEFERRLSTDILNNITQNGQIPFQISMSSDLAGESVINIRLGGEAPSRFVAPTFSDSLFSPVITRDANLPSNLSSDMLWLVQEVIPTNNKNELMSAIGYTHPVATPVNMLINNGVNDVANLGLL